MVKKKDTGDVFAMKTLRKDLILDEKMTDLLRIERDILKMADHPFLVNMSYVFQTEARVYFVMRFVRGGELCRQLANAEGRRFPEDAVRFYVIQVALALGHLHNKDIVYRDLKTENILMDADGYICVADFGLAKVLKGGEQA